ncbi:hypothetical protein AHAS_Ahas19G0147600 [Arachis hypogaea]
MSLLECCLKMIRLLKLSKKRNRVECMAWVSDQLPAKLEAKNLKKKAMEDEVASEKKKRQAMESALR